MKMRRVTDTCRLLRWMEKREKKDERSGDLAGKCHEESRGDGIWWVGGPALGGRRVGDVGWANGLRWLWSVDAGWSGPIIKTTSDVETHAGVTAFRPGVFWSRAPWWSSG